MKLLKTLLLFSFINYSIQSDQINYMQEIPNYLHFFIKFFIIFPFFEKLSVHFSQYVLLPDDLVYFDVFGNFIGDTKDLLGDDEICKKMLNYTGTFKKFADHLYRGEGDVPEYGWTDQEEIFNYPKTKDVFSFEFDKIVMEGTLKKKYLPCFNNIKYEESSEKWENEKEAYFSASDSPVDIKEMPKTFSTFKCIDVPLRSRFALVLESYLIDLLKLFYPLLSYSKISSFEDLLALVLFYLYVNIDENNLNRIYAYEVINDLRTMGTVLKLPKEDEMWNRIGCLKMLLDDVLKFDLYFTFNLFIHSKMLNLNSSALIKKVFESKNERLIKLLIKNINRNMKILDIEEGYDGNICHAIYWKKVSWLFDELLEYDDVDWNAADCRGYTVLGYMVNDPNSDELYKSFLQSTRHFNICYKAERLERNILEECLTIEAFHLSLSRLMAFLNKRRKSDDFGGLLISAAIQNRTDYFDLILCYRRFNCSHELDSAFQSLLQYIGKDKSFLYSFLLKILMWGRKWHGCKGNKLEHLFFMKWEIQLNKWEASARERALNIDEMINI